jgi:hypothetical protein
MKALPFFALVIVALSLGALIDSGSQACAAQARLIPLSAEEKADLVYMREEEKLARDVYLAMSAKWGAAIFSNIAKSEQTHMNSIATLLARYGVADPVAGMQAGQFATEKCHTLYAELVATGNQSLNDALAVGATIEEIDIIDLWDCLTVAKHADITRVYQNLEAASENHLRAFVGQLAARGVTYQPQYLTPEEYQQIVNP